MSRRSGLKLWECLDNFWYLLLDQGGTATGVRATSGDISGLPDVAPKLPETVGSASVPCALLATSAMPSDASPNPACLQVLWERASFASILF